ncbi:CPBP family intramembrane glutamic endopeptidase [Halobellus rarus]|uniref:CPBP family intramembrane glutamic endopeptidase n=1 Tax=Halobellus rarus TaxID=1126237 RepID=A0ABD6CPZ9_9EURY|nr:type II CAAX endopeptidase family protein [Halobellus rarus]
MSTKPILERVKSVLWNQTDCRPRALVRILLAIVLLVFTVVLVNIALTFLMQLTQIPIVLFAVIIVGQMTPIPVVLLAGYHIDRRVLADLGLGINRDWWVDLVFGSILGAALMSGVFVVTLVMGWIRIEGTFVVEGLGVGFAGGMMVMLVFWLVSGVSEELVLRGYLLTNIAEGLTGYASERLAVGIAVAVSSSLFGLIHAANPNASAFSILGIGVAGVLLAAGYLLTDELAIPIGLHITWNFFQGTIYGFGVSGFDFGVTLIEITETGPDVVTGGAFGPEAGLLGIAAGVVGIVMIVGYAGWRYDTTGLVGGVARPELRLRRRVDDQSE